MYSSPVPSIGLNVLTVSLACISAVRRSRRSSSTSCHSRRDLASASKASFVLRYAVFPPSFGGRRIFPVPCLLFFSVQPSGMGLSPSSSTLASSGVQASSSTPSVSLSLAMPLPSLNGLVLTTFIVGVLLIEMFEPFLRRPIQRALEPVDVGGEVLRADASCFPGLFTVMTVLLLDWIAVGHAATIRSSSSKAES